ncbi:MAG: hypothetical protein V1929_04980 [bacterium]
MSRIPSLYSVNVMRESSVFCLGCRFFCRTMAVACGLIAFFLAMELIKAFNVLYRVNHLLGYAFGACLAALAVFLALRLAGLALDHRTLDAPPRPDGDSATHDDMKAYCRYLIHALKRLGANPHLDEPLRQLLLQEAYNIDDTLGAHPLNDDLKQVIARNNTGALQTALTTLRQQAYQHARCRMKFVVEDVVEPPFPVGHSLVVIYHEIALVSDIVETYLGRPALFEHLSVMRDVWRVVTEGRFLTLGQDLFAAVYANTPPLGRAIDDIGSALTSIWLTRIIAIAAAIRCEAVEEWDTAEAIGRLEAMTEETMASVKETLTQDVLPILKLRLRHSAPAGTTDAAGFSKSIVDGIVRALDTLAYTLKHEPAATSSLLSRRHTVYDDPGLAGDCSPGKRERRRSRRRRGGLFRVFYTFAQRIRYTIGGPPDH